MIALMGERRLHDMIAISRYVTRGCPIDLLLYAQLLLLERMEIAMGVSSHGGHGTPGTSTDLHGISRPEEGSQNEHSTSADLQFLHAGS